MRLKIVSDGTPGPGATKVVNAETGEPLEHVTRILWDSGKPGEPPTAHVEFFLVEADAVGTVKDEPIGVGRPDGPLRHYAYLPPNVDPNKLPPSR